MEERKIRLGDTSMFAVVGNSTIILYNETRNARYELKDDGKFYKS